MPLSKRLLSCLVWLLFALIPPLVVSGAMVLPGAIDVMRTGMCPPAPPDIPAYPCTVGEYLLRMTLGPWALFGQIAIFGGWFVCVGILFLAYKAIVFVVRRLRSNQGEQPS